MDGFTSCQVWALPELYRLNQVRKFEKVHCMGVMSFGVLVAMYSPLCSPKLLTLALGSFPIEKPTSEDFILWNQALWVITSW